MSLAMIPTVTSNSDVACGSMILSHATSELDVMLDDKLGGGEGSIPGFAAHPLPQRQVMSKKVIN